MYIQSPVFLNALRETRLTEKHVTKTNRHRLGLDVVFERRLTQLAANTRLLVTTEWQLPVKSVVCVDPHCSGLERIGNLDGSLQVAGVEGGSETVCGGVANLDDLFLGLELGNCAYWAENLFLLDLHVLGDVGEDGGLNEVALVTLSLATSLDSGTGLLTILNVAKSPSQYRNFYRNFQQALPHDAVKLKL